MPALSPLPLERLLAWDEAWLRRMHHCAHYSCVVGPLRAVSRLADGLFWYVLIVAMAFVADGRGVQCALHMLLTGMAGSLLVHWIKQRTARPRPCHGLRGVCRQARVLDRFSFPSGHALHAVAFTLIAAAYYPGLALALLPFIVLVAVSRVVLGLHYPSDVLAGALLGFILALAGLAL